MPENQQATVARTNKKPKLMSEKDLHAAVADLLDWGLLSTAVWTTFPAGWGKLAPATAGRLKRCGLKIGLPDAFVFYDGRTIGLEFKVNNNKPSVEQQAMFYRLRQAGVEVYVCQSVDEVIEALVNAKIPMRSRCGWAQFKEDAHEASDQGTEARSQAELT